MFRRLFLFFRALFPGLFNFTWCIFSEIVISRCAWKTAICKSGSTENICGDLRRPAQRRQDTYPVRVIYFPLQLCHMACVTRTSASLTPARTSVFTCFTISSQLGTAMPHSYRGSIICNFSLNTPYVFINFSVGKTITVYKHLLHVFAAWFRPQLSNFKALRDHYTELKCIHSTNQGTS
jgi:hypothetical protein